MITANSNGQFQGQERPVADPEGSETREDLAETLDPIVEAPAAKPAPEPVATTTSLPQPRPGVPITRTHVAGVVGALTLLVVLRRRRRKRR